MYPEVFATTQTVILSGTLAAPVSGFSRVNVASTSCVTAVWVASMSMLTWVAVIDCTAPLGASIFGGTVIWAVAPCLNPAPVTITGVFVLCFTVRFKPGVILGLTTKGQTAFWASGLITVRRRGAVAFCQASKTVLRVISMALFMPDSLD